MYCVQMVCSYVLVTCYIHVLCSNGLFLCFGHMLHSCTVFKWSVPMFWSHDLFISLLTYPVHVCWPHALFICFGHIHSSYSLFTRSVHILWPHALFVFSLQSPVKQMNQAVIKSVHVHLRAYAFAPANKPMLTNAAEVQEATRVLKFSKAPSPDSIPNRALKYLPQSMIFLLVAFFKAIPRT
jgi:hypothetical protein